MLIDFIRHRFYFAPDAENGAAVDDPPEETEVPAGDEPASEPAEEPGTETVEEPGDPTGELMSALESMGLPTDPAQFQSSFNQLRQQAAASQEYQKLLWQMAAQRQQAQAPAPAPAAEAKKWEVPWGQRPDFDPKLISQLMTDDNGNIVAKPGAMPDIPARYQAYLDWQKQAQEKLHTDPINSLYPGFQPLIQEQIQAGIQQAMQQQAAQAQFAQMKARMDEFKQSNREWTHDAVTGQLTQAGQIWEGAFQQACQIGHSDPMEYATAMLDAQLARLEWRNAAQAPADGTPAPVASPANPRLDFLKGKNKPGRNGAAARPNGTKSPPRTEAYFEELRRKYDGLPASDFKKNPGTN